jgi:hypothetical protein
MLDATAKFPWVYTPVWVELIRSIAWPVVALIALLIVAFSGTLKEWLVEATRRLRKVSAFGVEIELSERVATKVRELSEDAFGAYRQRLTTEFDRLVHTFQLEDRHARLVEEHIRPQLVAFGKVPSFRCTIHIEDVLFTETLYQLLDYYPPARGPRGRTNSIRFGIVGKSWRTRLDQVERVSDDVSIRIRDWGMTYEEAATAGHGQQSFAAILLLDERGSRVAIVYLDSDEPGAFGLGDGRTDEFVTEVHRGAEDLGITESISAITQDLRARSPHIPIYDIGEPR